MSLDRICPLANVHSVSTSPLHPCYADVDCARHRAEGGARAGWDHLGSAAEQLPCRVLAQLRQEYNPNTEQCKYRDGIDG